MLNKTIQLILNHQIINMSSILWIIGASNRYGNANFYIFINP